MDIPSKHPALWDHAVQLFGTEQKARRWFHTRLSELDDRTPEEVLGQDAHSEEVGAILGRIEYGVFG